MALEGISRNNGLLNGTFMLNTNGKKVSLSNILDNGGRPGQEQETLLLGILKLDWTNQMKEFPHWPTTFLSLIYMIAHVSLGILQGSRLHNLLNRLINYTARLL